jgi:hypothetical protein
VAAVVASTAACRHKVVRGVGHDRGMGQRGVSRFGTIADHPHLKAQYDVEANTGLSPEQIGAGTHQQLWWACEMGPDHRWQASGRDRLHQGTGCPFCAGRRASITNNLLNHPELAAQFDVTANGGRTHDQIVATSHEQLWWRCPVADDHRWQNSGSARVNKGSGCLMCAGYRPSVTNNLTRFPEVAAQLDVAANGGLTPEQVVAGTMRKLSWACPVADDHRWRASGQDRTARGGTGCPMCAGKLPSTTNNLSRFPELAAQLDVAANGGLTPEQVVAGTRRMLWWICPHNPTHRWQAPGYTRIKDVGCPVCVLVQRSAREIRLAAELAAVLDLDLNEHRVTVAGARPLRVDVLCARRRLAVEYDGSYFHEHKLRQDRRKTDQLISVGYTVIRVREHPLPLLGPHDVAVSPKTPIHEVAARVLEQLAAARPDVLDHEAAAAYRTGGRPIATAAAEQRLASAARTERRGIGRAR